MAIDLIGIIEHFGELPEKKVFITTDDFIDCRIISTVRALLNYYTKRVIFTCIQETQPHENFTVGVRCSKCGKHYSMQMNRNELTRYIENDIKFKCLDCWESGDNMDCLWEDYRKKSTERFIDKYLTKDRIASDGATIGEKLVIMCGYYVSIDDIANYIKDMPYKDFLSTQYWKLIASDIKKISNKCEKCGASGGELHLHHRTYDHHGYELHNCMDLMVLCKNCHAKEHGIKTDIQAETK